MRFNKALYITAVFLPAIGSIAGGVMLLHEGALVVTGLCQILLFVLTFPLGAIAFAIGAVPSLIGIVTPGESMVLATPLYALLGYLQWWRILPALYRHNGG